jgi:hypothetical protein
MTALAMRALVRSRSARRANLALACCPVEVRLFQTWKAAAEAYASTAGELHSTADGLDAPERDRLRREADEAFNRAHSAHSALIKHRAEHGC